MFTDYRGYGVVVVGFCVCFINRYQHWLSLTFNPTVWVSLTPPSERKQNQKGLFSFSHQRLRAQWRCVAPCLALLCCASSPTHPNHWKYPHTLHTPGWQKAPVVFSLKIPPGQRETTRWTDETTTLWCPESRWRRTSKSTSSSRRASTTTTCMGPASSLSNTWQRGWDCLRCTATILVCALQVVWLFAPVSGEALHPGCVWKCHQATTSSTTLPHCHLHQAQINRFFNVSTLVFAFW